jgi:hypothetical protein
VVDFNCFDSLVTSVAGCTREVKSRPALENATFKQKKKFSSANWTCNLYKKNSKVLPLDCSLYGAENVHFGK